jgi:hypothetical protein
MRPLMVEADSAAGNGLLRSLRACGCAVRNLPRCNAGSVKGVLRIRRAGATMRTERPPLRDNF